MILFQLNIELSRRIKNKAMIFLNTIKQSRTTQKETSHKQCELTCLINNNLRLCLRQGVFSCLGSSLIEVLLLLVIVNIMLNLSLGLLTLSKDNIFEKVEIKKGCDIECVIKMDIP